MRDDDPVVLRRQLQAELRRLRDRHGLTQKEVATANDWSTSKLIRIEIGPSRIRLSDLRALLMYYQVTDHAERERLERLALASREHTWRDTYRQLIDPQFFSFLGYEAAANRIRQMQSMYIPELLQTADYAHSIAAAVHGATAPESGITLDIRRERQRIFAPDSDGPSMTFLMDQAVLVRRVGTPEVMRDQLRWLTELSQRDKVTIRYIPFDVGARRGMGASFIIFNLAADEDDRVVYLRDPVRDVLMPRDQAITEAYARCFAETEELACSEADTLCFLGGLVSEIN